MVYREIENVRHWFWNGLLFIAFIGVVLLLNGCGIYQSDKEYFAAKARANPPSQIMACVSVVTGKPTREMPQIIYKNGSWIEPGHGRVEGMTDLQAGTITLAHRGDNERLAHELAHWLGERDENMAEAAGRRCA